MPGPFPGMDPYLEQRWADIHARLIVYASNQLNSQLPDDLEARIEEKLSVQSDDEFLRSVSPDVRIVDVGRDSGADLAPSRPDVAVTEPLIVVLEPPRLRHLEIRDPAGRVVTAIEFLSPWNKIGTQNRRKYAEKQNEFLEAKVNLVEIDLIRQGQHVALAPLELIPAPRRGPYVVSVHRQWEPEHLEVYPATLRETLPSVRVPLRPTDRDVVLQVQSLVDDCYRDGRCERTDYSGSPLLPFDESDAAWVDELLRERGLR